MKRFASKGFTPPLRAGAGFTLAELLIATVILAFALSGLLLLFIKCLLLNEVTRNKAIAASHAEYIMEEIRGSDFNQIKAAIEQYGIWELNLNKSQIESSPYNLIGLPYETISATGSGSPGSLSRGMLGIMVRVSWYKSSPYGALFPWVFASGGLSFSTYITNHQ